MGGMETDACSFTVSFEIKIKLAGQGMYCTHAIILICIYLFAIAMTNSAGGAVWNILEQKSRGIVQSVQDLETVQ